MECTVCGSNKHTAKNCFHTREGSDNRQKLHCTICLKRDHNDIACPHAQPSEKPTQEVIDDNSVKD